MSPRKPTRSRTVLSGAHDVEQSGAALSSPPIKKSYFPSCRDFTFLKVKGGVGIVKPPLGPSGGSIPEESNIVVLENGCSRREFAVGIST